MQEINTQLWEYKIEYADWKFPLMPQQMLQVNVNMQLQKLGGGDWELVAAVPREMKDGIITGVAYIFKRPKK